MAPRLPESATRPLVSGAGLAALVVVVWVQRDAVLLPYERSLLVVVTLGLVMGLVSLVGARSRTARANPFDGARLLRKLLGLGATWAALAAVYALFPEYAGAFYQPCWDALVLLAVPLACVTPLYVAYVDRRQDDPEDALARLGAWILRRPGVSWDTALSQHALGWVVKGFFLPLMFVYLTNDLVQLQRDLDGAAPTTFMGTYDQLYRLGYLVDLAFTVVGYTFTLKLLDTHARSIEATAYGWAVCVLCYQPFWSVIGRQYLAYDDDGLMWGPALEGHPWLQYVWGGAILALVWIYAWATVTFGLRFSNLSHRGVLTSGPYRWTKHPAYLSKNVSWWLVAVPFLTRGTVLDAVRSCALLLLVNGIYLLRARAEEAHLGDDPAYQAYAAWIAEHGLIARLRRLTAGRVAAAT